MSRLFTRLRRNARLGIPTGFMGGYRTGAHPDLIPILYQLISDPADRKGYAFGEPVMATPTGLVFAYAGGTHYIFLKQPKKDLMMHAKMVDGSIRLTESTGSNFVWKAALALHQPILFSFRGLRSKAARLRDVEKTAVKA
jgi:hypothetical protein